MDFDTNKFGHDAPILEAIAIESGLVITECFQSGTNRQEEIIRKLDDIAKKLLQLTDLYIRQKAVMQLWSICYLIEENSFIEVWDSVSFVVDKDNRVLTMQDPKQN